MSLHSFLHRGDAPAAPKRITIRRRLVGRGSRLRTLGLAAGLLGLGLTLSQPAHATSPVSTKYWNGLVGDWFSNPSNWTLAGFPQPGDDAKNLFTNAAMTLGANATVNSFFSNSAFTLNGGTFSGSQANAASTLQVNNIFTLNGGQINNFTIQAGAQQTGQPAPTVVVANNGNNSLSNTIVNANVDMTQAGNGAYLALLGTDTVNGNISLATVNSDSYGLRLSNNATLVIGSTGALQGYGHISEDTNPSTLTNKGLVNATGGALIFNQSFFNNAAGATVEATGGGTLSLSHTNTNSGTIKATGAGSVVSITGSLTATGTAASGNLLTASGGGQIQINGASLLGTINTDAATALVMASNNLFNNTTLNGNLDMTQAGNGAYLALLGTDTVNGNISLATVNSDSYGLRLSNNATLLLNSGSSLVGYGHVSEDTNPSTLTNNGLVNATGALVLNQSFFNNAAGATAEATGGGTLSLNNTTNNSGMIKAVGAGSIVSITGTFTGTGNNQLTASGGGQINVNNATLLGTINTGAAALVMGSSGNNLFNNTTLNGNLDMTQAGNGAYLRLLGTDTVNGTINLATVNSDSYGLRLGNAATLVLSSGSSLVGYGHVSEDTNPSTLTNNGLVNATGALVLNQSFFNNAAGATAEATGGGTLSLNNTTNNSGMIKAVGAGSIVSITGTFTGTGNNQLTASGGGQINVNNATLLGTINTGAAALVMGSSGNNLFNNTTLNGNLDMTQAGNGAYLRLLGTDTVNGTINLATVNSDSYGLRLGNAATLVLSSGSSLVGYGHVSEDTNPSTLTNNGLVNANSAGNTLVLNQTTFNNAAGATAEATGGGSLSLNNTTNNSGMIKAVGAGSIVSITGTFTGTGSSATNQLTASGGGQVQINGASLLGTINTGAAALVLASNGNNLFNNTTLNGNLDMTQAGNGAYLRLLGTDTVNGNISLATINSDGYGLRLGNAATLVLSSGSSLVGYGHVSEDTNPSTLTNNGLVNANSAGNTLVLNQTTFNNAGTAQVTNGATLVVSSNSTNSGVVNVQGGGTANFSGLTQTAGLTQVDGVLNLVNNSALTLNGTTKGGTLLGSGQINGNVVNTNGIVSPGDSPGTLTINGNYTQGSAGSLNIEFLGTQNSQHDLLNILGLSSLTGTLDVNYLGNGSGLAVGSQFAFLDYGTLSAPTVGGLTQYFLNETPLTSNTGTVVGHNGFTYELINDTANKMLDLQVLTVGAPAVPEASTTVSLGLLLALGMGGLVVASKRKKKA